LVLIYYYLLIFHVLFSFGAEINNSNFKSANNNLNAITHTWDLAEYMPEHLAIMFSMSWFGIPSSDPQGAGPDPSYGNWVWGGGCIGINNAAKCNTNVTSSEQRWLASKRRPLAGMYSASARDAEGQARVDLMLSTLRRPCDDGAKIDAWAVQQGSIRDSSRYPNNPLSVTSDISYRAMLEFFERAQNANMSNVILPGQDSTFYFHFGNDLGLGYCNATSGTNAKSKCLDALTSDLIDMIDIASTYKSALRINGKLVILYYVDSGSQYASVSEWQTILSSARNQVAQDFYVIGTTENPSFFAAFDALLPWINLGQWADTSGANVTDHALAWVALEHAAIFDALSNYSGRVVFGGASPGFDDYTEDWGNCKPRELPSPPDKPRDPNVLDAEFEYFISKKIKGVLFETWDDWTEGSEIEPDVVGGPAVLLQVRQLLGKLFNEPPDPAGDQRLVDRWNNYGQARNCDGGSHGIPPVTYLNCSTIY